MQPHEIITELTNLKKQVTALGHAYLKNKLPIEVDKLKKQMAPFIIVEQAFDKAITRLQKSQSSQNNQNHKTA